MMAERAQHCSFTKHMQIERHQQINKTSPSCAAHPHNPTKYRNVDFKITTKVKMNCYVYICSASLFLCREHLQCLCCQTDEDVFLICMCFFFHLQHIELSRPPYFVYI